MILIPNIESAVEGTEVTLTVNLDTNRKITLKSDDIIFTSSTFNKTGTTIVTFIMPPKDLI